MKKTFLALAMMLGAATYGQQANSLLWKITGKDLKEPSYLFGTMHIMCDATLDPATLKALDATKQVYLEMDMDDPNLQAELMGGIMMKDGKTMSSMMSEDDFKLLDKLMTEKMGTSAAMFNSVKPIMLSTMMIPSLIECPPQSIEGEIVKVAGLQKEEVLGLETIQDQLAIFDAVPYQTQVDELMRSVRDGFAADKKEMLKMIEVYKSADLNAMLKMMDESPNKLSSGFQDVLLTGRNKKWIPKIEEIAKATPTFFGVGAAHLGGENGVIALLKKKGYKVEPVK
ncbi:MAG TPA: TraB/GumN family protein [Flavobacterium sp.]|jgi:hypothetical protein